MRGENRGNEERRNQELEREIDHLRSHIEERRSDAIENFSRMERYANRGAVGLASLLVISHPIVINSNSWAQIYPAFSILIFVSILTLLSLSVINLLKIRKLSNNV